MCISKFLGDANLCLASFTILVDSMFNLGSDDTKKKLDSAIRNDTEFINRNSIN